MKRWLYSKLFWIVVDRFFPKDGFYTFSVNRMGTHPVAIWDAYPSPFMPFREEARLRYGKEDTSMTSVKVMK